MFNKIFSNFEINKREEKDNIQILININLKFHSTYIDAMNYGLSKTFVARYHSNSLLLLNKL